MIRWDAWLMAVCERWCHRIQRWIGVTNFRIAMWLYSAVNTGAVLAGLIFWQSEDAGPAMAVIVMMMAVGIFMMRGSFVTICDGLEAYYEGADAAAHPMTLEFRSHWLIRLMFQSTMPTQLLLLALLADRHFLLFAAAAICGLSIIPWSYALCVIPLPPSQGKVQEWIASFQQEASPVFVPVE